jgi:hypothetical protein
VNSIIVASWSGFNKFISTSHLLQSSLNISNYFVVLILKHSLFDIIAPTTALWSISKRFNVSRDKFHIVGQHCNRVDCFWPVCCKYNFNALDRLGDCLKAATIDEAVFMRLLQIFLSKHFLIVDWIVCAAHLLEYKFNWSSRFLTAFILFDAFSWVMPESYQLYSICPKAQ